MEITTSCPGCNTKVRVPETLLGKMVKCPKCHTTFTAADSEPGFEEVPDDEPRPQRPLPSGDNNEEDGDDRGRRRGRSNARSAQWGTRTTVVKSIGVLSVGKVLGCVYALLGLIIGGLFTLLSLAGAAAARGGPGAEALIFGVGAVVIIPAFYGAIGFIGGIIMAAIYNLVASIIGGIEIEFSRGVH